MFDDFLTDLAAELRDGTFDRALLAFDGEIPPKSTFANELSNFKDIARPEIADAIEVLNDNTQTSIEDYINSLIATA